MRELWGERMIHDSHELASEVGVDEPSHISRAIYKGTACGAWVRLEPHAVAVGSIVEGSDAEVGPVRLVYPFTAADFWAALDEINAEACALWHEANEEDE
jgi:hypothetical protein